jgi:probable F420-dependent oxidoreductase
MRVGVILPRGVAMADAAGFARAVAALGYTDLWTGESDWRDGITPLAVAAAAAPSLRVGTAVLPVTTRGPALLAMTAASLASAAPGRVVIGVGASSPLFVQDWNGVPYERPVERVRDTVRFLKRALAGERIDADVDHRRVRGFRLGAVPEVVPPIVVGALRERMLTVGAVEADGVALTCLGAGDAARVAALVHERRPASAPVPEIVCWVPVAPVEGDALVTARELARRRLTGYLISPPYAAYHRWLGRGDALAELWARWDAGDRRGAVAALPDDVVDDLYVLGSPSACVEHLRRFAAAGVTTLLLEIVDDVVDPLTALRDLRAVIAER